MTTQESIDALTTQTTALLQSSLTLKNGVAQQISDAVTLSRNAAQIPLVTISTNLITMQALLIPKL